jgi:glycosyltransferase involved in cell wall biosynthesis
MESIYIDGLRIYRVCAGRATPITALFSTLHNSFIASKFTEVLRNEEPEVIHLQHLKGLPAKLVFSAGKKGIPMVLTLHDYWFICPNAQLITPSRKICDGPRLWLNCVRCATERLKAPYLLAFAPLIAFVFAYRNLLLRRILNIVELVIAPTAFVRNFFIEKGIPERKIHFIEHGIDTLNLADDSREEKDRLHFAYIGGLSWQKGVHILIEAFNSIDPFKAKLFIYGDERAFPGYSQMLRQLAFNPSIVFRGEFNHDRLWEILSDVDVLIVPSLWYETSCLVVQEAFAARVPVIASFHGALAEKVKDGIDGLLVPPGDPIALRHALETFIEDEMMLRRLKANIKPIRSMKGHADEIEAIYNRVLRRSIP